MGRTFEIPARCFKHAYLEVPPDFKAEVGGDVEREPVYFHDLHGNQFIVDWFPGKGLLGRLGDWYRRNQVTPDETIIVEIEDSASRTFRIWVSGREASGRPPGLYLGRSSVMVGNRRMGLGRPYCMPVGDLVKHCFICGATGSGKTVLGKAIIEEAVFARIPSVIVDLKGDLTSLALAFENLSPEEFYPWVDGQDDRDRRQAAEESSRRHRERLAESELSAEDVRRLARGAFFRIFTPLSSKGTRMSVPSLVARPENALQLSKDKPDEFESLVRSVTFSFIDRLYPDSKYTKIDNERAFLYELIKAAWLDGESLEGRAGLLRLLQLVESPPFDEIGGLPLAQYIDAEGRRARLLNKINTLLAGPALGWFDGEPFVPEKLIEPVGGRTPVNIVNVADLEFEDRSFVVQHIALRLFDWVHKLPGTEKPRLVFFIDEIGGGGGKQSLFPSHPYHSAAKWGLNYLLRQGRAYGLSCVFATQNPGDVDYKGLTNCGTWMVGRLATKLDRQKVLQGMAVMGMEHDKLEAALANADVGDFVVRDARSDVHYVHERWLCSYHRVLTSYEVGKVNAWLKERQGCEQ